MSDAPPPPAEPSGQYPPPAGYGQPVAQAGYGQPVAPTGYGQPVAPTGYAPAQPTTNVLAIISLVISILGFNVIAIILGAVGLSQIKRTGEKGRGLALAGIWIGAISIVLGIIIAIVFVVVFANVGISTQTS
jgi:peptidyl-prolyl cis-trans isomerase B (cyclophilin B)